MFAPRAHRRFAWYFTATVALVVIAGIIATVVVVKQVQNIERRHLLERSNTVASALNVEAMESFSGTEADLDVPEYLTLRNHVIAVREANPDVRFVYVLAQNGDDIFFVADSESEDSEDYSPPGQVYDEASDVLITSFASEQAAIEGPVKDRWGNWLSAFSPLYNQYGEFVGMVGLDIAAQDFYVKQITAGAVPALIALIILIFIVQGARVRRKEQEVMDLKSEFLSIAAHEIRTPLTGIRWATESLLTQTNDPHVHIGLGKIQRSALVLIDRVNSLLDVSRFEAGSVKELKLAPIDVTAILYDLKQALGLAAQERSINVSIAHTVPHPLMISGDEEKLRQALNNILSNAIKYSREGGSVQIDYSRAQGSPWFSITIADSGIGIPKGEQSKVFTGYYRAKNAKRLSTYGSGFGLYLAKKIVEAHRGTISFVSEEGKGTTFTITLRAL